MVGLKQLSAAFALCVAAAADAGTVGMAYIGNRSEERLEMFEAAVVESGCEVKKLTGPTAVLEKPETFEGLDAIVLTGGWNDGGQLSRAACRNLVGFAAKGGGVFLGAFRGGGVRNFGYAAFPDVGEVYNKVASPWIRGTGRGLLAAALGTKPLMFGGFDHMVVRPGKDGEVFARCGEDPVGVCGRFGSGRVVVLSLYISTPEDDSEAVRKKNFFKAVVRYIVGTGRHEADDAAKEALAAFDRRMAAMDWTFEERGCGRVFGTVPRLRDEAVIPVEGKAMLLEFLEKKFGGFKGPDGAVLAKECGAMAKRLRGVSDAIRRLGDEKSREVVPVESLKAGFAALAAKAPVAEADALVERARAALRARRKAELAAEHAEDLKALPALVSRLSSPLGAVRLEAATELGRICEATPEAVAALVAALGDSCDRVRVQAAISLGWMQAKAAVPALIAKAHQNGDMPLKRRAVQALGQIGDERAIPEVLEALESTDRYTVENAILALGWMKAVEAVPRLVQIASDETCKVEDASYAARYGKNWIPSAMNRRSTAVTALGYIGDRSAIPALREIARRNAPNGRYDEDPTIFANGASLNRFAADAIKAIEAGGRPERGVRQPDALSSKERFYTMTRKNHVFAGRIGMLAAGRPYLRNGGETLLIPYILDGGFTGFHHAWDEIGDGCSSEKANLKLAREMEDYGLVYVGIAPCGGLIPLGDVLKGAQERVFELVGDCASYAGAWGEECWPDKYVYEGSKLQEDPDPRVCRTSRAQRAARVARLEAGGVEIATQWRETQDWLRARRKGFAMTFTVSRGNMVGPVGTPAAADRIDVIGLESYENFGIDNAYLCERLKNGDARPVMTEFYNMYTPSLAHDIRGCWLGAVHGKSQFPFTVAAIAPFFGFYCPWAYEKGRWGCYKKTATHVRDNAELYEVSPTATQIAVLRSERSAASFFYSATYRQLQVMDAADQAGRSVWTALSQSHLPADVVLIDGAGPEKLAKYKVLFLTAAKILTADERNLLRDWVAAGGTLVCEGTVSLFEPEDLSRRGDYAISGLLGVEYRRTDFMKSKDVFAQMHGEVGGRNVYPAEPGLDNFYMFSQFTWRDFKPSDCVAKTADGTEYDASLGIDRVELAGAKTVQAFKDGSPALTVNEYGKGRVWFFASNAPALGQVNSRWESGPNKVDFWPGVRETYEKIARDGLSRAGTAPAIELLGAPKEVELTVFSQKGGDRLVVHLLDYDTVRGEVSGARLRIGGDRAVKRVWRVGGGEFGPDVELPVAANRTVDPGTFAVYCMIAVEF